MPGIAAYGTPRCTRTPPAPGCAGGIGSVWAGGGRGTGDVGTATTSALRVRPVVVRREELHVVLLSRGLHAREVGDERRLVLGRVVGLGAHVLEEPLEAAGQRAHHPGVL